MQHQEARENFPSTSGFPPIRAGVTTTETSSTGYPPIRADLTSTETSSGFPPIRAGLTTRETSSIGFPPIRASVTSTETSSRFPKINPFPELRPVIKQEPDIDQINKLKPANDDYLESVGNSSQQHQQEVPHQQTTSTSYDEFQNEQKLLLRQYQEQHQAQLLLQQQQSEQQLLSSQQQNNAEVLQSVGPLKSHEGITVKTEPGVKPTTLKSGSSQTVKPTSASSSSVSSWSSEPKTGLEATSPFSSDDLTLIASIDKTTVLIGLVREYIDSQRGILEICKVGHSGLLMEPVAGNFKMINVQLSKANHNNA